MLCGLSSFLFALDSLLPVQPAFCIGPGCWLCLLVPPPRPSQPRQARWAPVPGRARGLRCLLGPEGKEGQYLDVQLIHLSPELGGALGDHDDSRRHVNVKGTVTPCGRRRPCSAGRAQGREPCQAGSPVLLRPSSESPPQSGPVSGAAGTGTHFYWAPRTLHSACLRDSVCVRACACACVYAYCVCVRVCVHMCTHVQWKSKDRFRKDKKKERRGRVEKEERAKEKRLEEGRERSQEERKEGSMARAGVKWAVACLWAWEGPEGACASGHIHPGEGREEQGVGGRAADVAAGLRLWCGDRMRAARWDQPLRAQWLPELPHLPSCCRCGRSADSGSNLVGTWDAPWLSELSFPIHIQG